jgi:hypothetical protein
MFQKCDLIPKDFVLPPTCEDYLRFMIHPNFDKDNETEGAREMANSNIGY